MLQWAPCFEGLDVCLKGLAQGISRMFPISLQPNWAERQQNSACFCLAHFTFPNIYSSLYPVFIIRKVMQAWAATGLWGRTYESLIPNYCCPELMHKDRSWGLKERPAGAFLSLRQQTQMAVARAGDQIRWTAPNGWAIRLPVVTDKSNWEKRSLREIARGEQSVGSSVYVANDEKLKWHFFWEIAVYVVSDLRPAVGVT